jgi:hypothetical protein
MHSGGNDFDPSGPMKEAAMFYSLFLRGHPVEALRRDIDVPRPLLEKWLSHVRYDPELREKMKRAYEYRKQVLAIFDELVTYEKRQSKQPN